LSREAGLCHNEEVDEILQAQPAIDSSEGLPFWLLWFLLCVIVLLVAFIFLRDKDLRRRVSSFLSGARRHMLRLRLQVKLKKEKQKKTALWQELGKLSWNEDFRAPCIEEECAKLASLEDEIGRHQKTWHDVYSRIEVLGREHEAALKRYRALVAEQEEARRPHQEEVLALANRKAEVLEALESSLREAESAEIQLQAAEKDVRAAEDNPKLSPADRAARTDKARDKAAGLAARVRALRERIPLLQEERYRLDRRLEEAEGRIRVFNAAIRRIDDEYRERLQAREKEIREWQRAKEHVQDKIVGVKRLMEPLFENVGRILDESRIDHEDMSVLYFQIDGVNRTIADIEARLEHLK
jgi:DNA repair exonuclease SbcCD ATPase subunit